MVTSTAQKISQACRIIGYHRDTIHEAASRNQRPMKYSRGKLCVLVLATGLALIGDVAGQTTPNEHAQHHPQPGAAN